MASSDYISREETLKRLCRDVCNVSDCQCDEIRCPEWYVIHDAPAAIPSHGRLIDADKMQESIRRQTGLLKLMGGELAEIAETLEKGFLQEIDNAPTIIPAEEEP